MKRFFLLLVGVIAFNHGQSAVAQTTAIETAEKRLADLLSPGGMASPSGFAAQPVQWKGSPAVEDFSLPVRPIAGQPVRLPNPPRKDVKPRAVPEGLPLVSFADQPKVPKGVELPTKPLIKLPSVDVHAPLPIPILAVPHKDRASVGEPALEASLDAAMKRFTPAARTPIPFVPLNLPDPFEHIRSGQVRNPPEENPTPPAIPLDRPKR